MVAEQETEGRLEITQAQIDALKNKNVAVITVTMPPAMRDAITEASDAKDQSAANWARQVLADAVNFTLPTEAVGRARKYATEEERIAANKERAKSRRDVVNELMRRLKEGEISL